jgi:hypothetical protein
MTATAIKQWVLTEDESVESLRSWRDHLLIILAHEECFAPFLTTDATWSRKSRNNTFRGFTGPDAANLAARLELMLGLIATAAPVLSRHTIIKTSTSLASIWEALWRYYGFHPCVSSIQVGLQFASCMTLCEDEIRSIPMDNTMEKFIIIAPNQYETDDEIFNETPVDDQPEECDTIAPVDDQPEECDTIAPVDDKTEMCRTEARVVDQDQKARSTLPGPCIDVKFEGEVRTLPDVHTDDDREKNIFFDDLAKDDGDEHCVLPNLRIHVDKSKGETSSLLRIPADPYRRGTLRQHDTGSAVTPGSPTSRAAEGSSESPFPCDVAEERGVASFTRDVAEERGVSSFSRDFADETSVSPSEGVIHVWSTSSSLCICSLGVRDDDDLGIVFLECRSDASCEEEGDASDVVAGCSERPSLRTAMTQTSTVPTVQHVQSVSEFMCDVPVLGVVLDLAHDKVIFTSNLTARRPRITREVCKEAALDATRPCTTRIVSTGRPPDSMFFATIGTSATQDVSWPLTVLFVLRYSLLWSY